MRKYVKYLVPSLISFLILSIIFYFNNLYPFGNKPLMQVDADWLYIPTLYKIYDLLHNGGNLFYSLLGLGNSIYGSLIIQGSLFSPLNLILYFIDRNSIINFFGLFIIIKLCLISLTSYIYIDNKYKNIEYFYKLLFSILYTFSGFIIFNYYNEIWLEFVIVFPLLVMYLDKVLEDKNEFGYIIVLSTSIIISLYYSMFILIFILFYSSISLYLYKKRENRKIIFKLGKSTLISLLISSFSSLPLLYQILNSGRFNAYADITLFSNFYMKSLHILFSPLFIIIFLKLLTKYKKDKINILKYILLIILYIVPIIFDPINAFMHGGSYWDLPYRYGFIPLFILFDASLYYIDKFSKYNKIKISFLDVSNSIIIILLVFLGIILNYYYRNEIISKDIFLKINNRDLFHILYMLLIIFLMYLTNNFMNNIKLKKIMLSIISIYSIFMLTSWTIYYDGNYNHSINVQKISENINIKRDGRYKVEYIDYNPYYGHILNVPTLDNWIHLIPKGQKDTYVNLGYFNIRSVVGSYGGTIFTDWLLNFKYLFSLDEKNDNLYEKIDNYDNRYLYEYKYNRNYGIVFDNLDDLNFDKNLGKFEYQNRIYKNLFNTDNNIIDYKNYRDSNKKQLNIEYQIENEGYLYILDYNNSINYVSINGNNKYVFEDFITYLGNYKENINLAIYFNNDDDINFDIGFIKKEDIMSLKSNVKYEDNRYYVNVEEEGKYLFLPINNIDGIKVYNNGKKIDVEKYLDNFVCIKLDKGENLITLEYKLPLFNLGIVLSLIGLILLIFSKKIIANKYLLDITNILYKIFIILIIAYYYLYSLFNNLFR